MTDIPADLSLPRRNRQVLLTSRPAGIPQASDFKIAEAEVPVVTPGTIRVRNIFLSVDPAQRGWASSEANYSAPVPLGNPMRGLAVARVIDSLAEGFSPGDLVYGFFGWQDVAVVPPDAVLHRVREDIPIEGAASLLGINGVTAYLALTRLGRPVPGDVLVVSTAAGSVGSFAGQIGAAMGCRTIGITSSADKIERCRTRYGYAAALSYRESDLADRLHAAAPDGINVFYDNTGGAILDTVLRQMSVGGRVVQCGTASIGSWTPPPTGPRNEREILTRRLVWSGFVIFDHRDAYAEAAQELTAMWKQGKVVFDSDISDGIEAAPGAIATLYDGTNTGKKLIRIV